MIKDILEVYDNYHKIGIQNRRITEGEEIELVREYIDYRKNRFKPSEKRKMMVFIETKIGNAYPDIVFVEYNPKNYESWNKEREDIDKCDLKILHHLYTHGGLAFRDIVSQLGKTWRETAQSVEKLLDAGLIIRDGQRWNIKNKKTLRLEKIIAVEAKINKWQDVYQQSLVNQNFASESYALSINDNILKQDILDRFKKRGIGVYLKKNSTFKMIGAAKKNIIPISFNSILVNEYVGRIIHSQEKVNAF